MRVRATAITQSLVEDLDLSPEELIIYEARVSNPENQGNVETSDKLLKFLIDNAHYSPFDMVNLTVEVTTSKMIAIQILRHWSIKLQEFSQRYSAVEEIEPMEFRLKADKNRQSSTEIVGRVSHMIHGSTPSLLEYNKKHFFTTFSLNTELNAKYGKWLLKIAKHSEDTLALYNEGLELGIAKESARQILPMATSTTMYLNGSVRSWIFYLQQRTSEHAQKEHKIVAKEIEKVFKQYFPNVAKALNI